MAFFKKFRDAQRPCCAALVAAAGSSSRMGGVNKLLQPLDGIPVLARTLTALQMARLSPPRITLVHLVMP